MSLAICFQSSEVLTLSTSITLLTGLATGCESSSWTGLALGCSEDRLERRTVRSRVVRELGASLLSLKGVFIQLAEQLLIINSNPRKKYIRRWLLIIIDMNKSEMQGSEVLSSLTFKSPLTTRRARRSLTLSEESSSYLSSNYRRYVIHLAAGQQPDQQDDYHIFWNVVCKCILYLKREFINDQLHDEILSALLRPHFDLARLDPTPISDVGQQLMRCGYFLAAYAVLLIRLRKKGTGLLEYFRAAYSKFRLKFGEAEMHWYLSDGHPCTGNVPAVQRSIRTDDPIVRSFGKAG